MSKFVSITDIREAKGLRMTVLRGVPSPWTEAAKGIFHAKGLNCLYGAQADSDPPQAIAHHYGNSSVPVVLYDNEKPRTGWPEILILAERLSDSTPLIPDDAEDRVDLFGVAHEICGEMGLGWAQRLVMIGDTTSVAFPAGVSRYLAGKYGHNPVHAESAHRRVASILRMLSNRLEQSDYLVANQFTAADIYWATFANLLIPLPESLMQTTPMIRSAYACQDERLLDAISTRLAAHQRRIYEEFLELPVVL